MWVLSEVMEVRAVTSNQSLPDFPVMREFTGNFAQFWRRLVSGTPGEPRFPMVSQRNSRAK